MVVINDPNFSIPQICDSGQCFRLEPVGNGEYVLQAADRYLKIRTGRREQTEERGLGKWEDAAENESESQTILYCTEEEYHSFWETYFDLNVSYRDYLDRIDPEDAYLIRAAAFGSGIRILRQDVWEMIITFILSQQNNIPRIRKMIRELSHSFGEKKEAEDGTFYYGFPTPERLAGVSEDELREMKFGYRSRYICGSAASVADGRFDLASLTGMEYGRAKEELIKLPGIGGKVADCICLFALHHMDAFPVDTHIKSVMDTYYSAGFPFERYRGCAGVMQQYIFYYDLKGNN